MPQCTNELQVDNIIHVFHLNIDRQNTRYKEKSSERSKEQDIHPN